MGELHNYKHGGYKTPEYTVWQLMKDRCRNPNGRDYAYYGARGIRVYPGWVNNFAAFLAHVGPRPSPKHTLDRIDNDAGYEPGNVRWVLRKEQQRNQRRTRLVDGVPLIELAEKANIPFSTVRMRLARGWDLERALRR